MLLATKAAIDAVIGDEQVEDRRDERLAVLQLQRLAGTLRIRTSGWSVPRK